MAYPKVEKVEIKIVVEDDFVTDFNRIEALKKGISFSEHIRKLMISFYNAQAK